MAKRVVITLPMIREADARMYEDPENKSMIPGADIFVRNWPLGFVANNPAELKQLTATIDFTTKYMKPGEILRHESMEQFAKEVWNQLAEEYDDND